MCRACPTIFCVGLSVNGFCENGRTLYLPFQPVKKTVAFDQGIRRGIRVGSARMCLLLSVRVKPDRLYSA
jgi:hypothetical protein